MVAPSSSHLKYLREPQNHTTVRKQNHIYPPTSITTSTIKPSTSLSSSSLSTPPELPYSQTTMGLPVGEGLKTAIIQPGMFHKSPFSTEVPGIAKIEGETIPRRNAKYVDALWTRPRPKISTVYDVLTYARDKYGSAPGLGSRPLLSIHKEAKVTKEKTPDGKEISTTKNWAFYEMGPFEWVSYEEYFDLAIRIGQSLRKVGLEPGERVHIYAATSMRWLAMSHGAATQSMPIVTSYATLGESGLETSLVQTQAKAIFVDPDLISKLGHPLVKAKNVRFVIYNDVHDAKKEDIDKLQSLHPHLTILGFNEFLELSKHEPVAPVPPQRDDLCCIMYTSGTTGEPKGVPLTHKNVVAALAGLESIFKPYVGSDDSVLAYLPLAHSFEYAFETVCLLWGTKMGYGSPRTLLDNSMRNCKGDIKELRPTILVGVPAVWDQVRKGIEGSLKRKGWFPQWLFSHALRWKTWLCENDLPGPGLLDTLVFKSVKRQFGGRLRACFNGAGPLSRKDRSFISYTVAPLVMGYGLTETAAMGALQDPLEWTDDTLGDIPASVEIKLVDFVEAGYFAKNDEGEIWIRGDAVMSGYYDNESETEKAMAPDGWFRTGDIGAWAPNGHLKLLDRKKNLVKTSLGEYIALEKLESIYRSSGVVSNICICATGEERTILAIVVPRKDIILALAKGCNNSAVVEKMSYSQLLQDEGVRSLVCDQLRAEGRKGGLQGAEIIQAVILTDNEWTTENGLLTPAQKLQRRKIYPVFEKEIREIYAQHNGIRSRL